MRNITMTTSAVSCVASARPANVILAADRVQVQGTGVSIAVIPALRDRVEVPTTGLRPAVAGVDFATNHKPSDVARSRSGRPPV